MKQNTQEWHKIRIGKLTASRVGAALGINPWQNPDDLIRSMVREAHGAEPEFRGNIATNYGKQHEPLAALDYMSDTTIMVEECGFYTHPDYPWLGASPDGFIGDGGILEIKCPFGQRDKNPPQFKSIYQQLHYYAQVQVQLACTGREWCHFYQWSPHGKINETVRFDPEWWKDNFPKMEGFYNRYLVELDNPEHLVERTAVINGKRYEKMLARYDELKRIQDAARSEQQDILQELISVAGERSAEICGRKLTRVERVGSVSYSKVVKDHLPDIDLEPYRGEASVSWRLS